MSDYRGLPDRAGVELYRLYCILTSRYREHVQVMFAESIYHTGRWYSSPSSGVTFDYCRECQFREQ